MVLTKEKKEPDLTTTDTPTMSRRRLGFVAASLTLGTVFAAAGSPVSLYETYRLDDGVGTGQLAVVAASYFVAVAVALLFFGRLSNHIGRKPVAFAALGLATAGCLLMLEVHSATPLIAGRALQGLGGGLASSAVAAYIVDTAPEKPAWLASTITGTVPMFGLPAGALLSGALVEFEPAPRRLIYLVIVALLAVCTVLVAFSPETVRRLPGALSSIRPAVSLPPASRKVLPYAAAVILGTWVMGAFNRPSALPSPTTNSAPPTPLSPPPSSPPSCCSTPSAASSPAGSARPASSVWAWPPSCSRSSA